MIDAIVFDLDDTLYLESDYVASGYRAVARHIARRNGRSYREIFYTMMSSFVNQGRNRVLPLVIERYTKPRMSVGELVDVYRCHVPRIRMFPGYARLLRSLKRQYRLGIITDGHPEVQRRKAEALGLTGLVDRIIYTWDLGAHNEKPHPLPFSLMLESLKAEPRNALFIGDNPFKDRSGARGVGMQFARVLPVPAGRTPIPRDGQSEAALESLHQLPQLLEILRG